ncbi:MAG: DsbA family protein [Candidatus Kerfeldbacteria bacterium]|nr:DsbA family protein [Candidatus Kerfeldbacteria bacterium]
MEDHSSSKPSHEHGPEHHAHEPKKPTPGSMFAMMPSKFAFWAGFITAVAAIAVIGCIIMLTFVFQGGTINKGTKTTNTNVAAANSNKNGNTNTQPTATATVNMDQLTNIQGSGDTIFLEYSDLECPYCKQYHNTIEDVYVSYKDKMKRAYKHFPLNRHPKANREAQASECAAEQGKFWEYTDRIFDITPSNNGLEDSALYTVADELKLDRTTFDSCLDSAKYKDKVAQDGAEALKMACSGTPCSFIIDSTGNVLEKIGGADGGALSADGLKATLDQYVK